MAYDKIRLVIMRHIKPKTYKVTGHYGKKVKFLHECPDGFFHCDLALRHSNNK